MQAFKCGRIATTLALVLASTLAACGGETSLETSHESSTSSALQAGGPTFAVNPGTGGLYVAEANSGGIAPSLKVLQVLYGRLADVYDLDQATGVRTLRFRELLIGANIASNGIDFTLEEKPLTQRTELTVLHAFGTPEFANAFAALEAGLQPFLIKSFDPGELPPFTAMPRNAALAIRCDDLLRDGGNPGNPNYPGTVNAQTVKLLTGVPIANPFEARVFPDPNHGGLEGGGFHSTRVLVDVAISELEALATNLPVNPIGLPEAQSIAVANAGLRLPTVINASVGQLQVLTNVAGAKLSFTGNGPTDPLSPTLDVVRAFRSGGATVNTGDPHNGFLPDSLPPSLLVKLACYLSAVNPIAGTNDFRVRVRFPDSDCVPRMRAGDLLATAGSVAELVQVGATGAIARLVQGSASSFTTGAAQFQTTWSPATDLRPECALRILPQPGNPPTQRVATNASFVFAFSEPMAPTSVRPFDSFTVRYPADVNPTRDYVVGAIAPSVGLTDFTFQPTLPLQHISGQSELYRVALDGSANGVTDLAGNPLAIALPQVEFSLEPTQPSVDTGGVTLRFAAVDEDGNGAPELRGQFLFDLAAQEIRPRPVTRFSTETDASRVVQAMVPLPAGVQTPLVPQGSRTQSLWRYHDLGLGLLDEATHNLDVEGLSWSPASGALVADSYSQFQMSLTHSKFLPDEELSSGLLPNWPSTGLVTKYADNNYDALDPPVVVHAANKGYTVDPSDIYPSVISGAPMTHWPMNRGVPQSQYTYWTWRDTSKTTVGGPNGQGADTRRLYQVTKQGNVGFYPAGKVPTIALPLLTEIRTYPDAQANGLNAFRVAIAINSSANPYFRAYSSGYVTCSIGAVTNVNPDTHLIATGGYDPVNCITSNPRDNVFYYGQADFVVRVSRLHTIWFDTFGASTFAPVVLEPGSSSLPAGTQVSVAFRGATAIASANVPFASWTKANFFDAYGDGYTPGQLFQLGLPGNVGFTPSFFPAPADNTWKTSLALLNGARYVQARVSFIGNPQTQAVAKLSTFAVAFQH